MIKYIKYERIIVYNNTRIDHAKIAYIVILLAKFIYMKNKNYL